MRQVALAILAVTAFVAAPPSRAQEPAESPSAKRHYTGGIVSRFDDAQDDFALEPAALSARIAPATAERPAVLLITARIAPGRHTYSLTQPPGGPRPTKIELEPSSDYRLLAPLAASAPKSRVEQGPVWTGLKIEEHEGEVTWYAPIELTAGVDPAKFEIRGTAHMEVCQTGGYCEPVEKTFAAKLAKISDIGFPIADWPPESAIQNPQSAIGTYQSKSSAVKFEGALLPGTVRPGETAELQITATLPENGRIYAHADRDVKLGTKPVLIAIQTASGLVPRRPTTDAPIKTDESVPQFGPMRYHEGTVTWTLRLDVPKNAPLGEYPVTGLIGYQACEYGQDGKNVCELPQAVEFEGKLTVGDESGQSAAPLTLAPSTSYSKVAGAAAVFADHFDRQSPGREQVEKEMPVIVAADAYELDRIVVGDSDDGSLSYYIALAFVGGLILNLMPCVLPVIGLKVMSFVDQAGENRTHALALNLWFTAGIIAVFLTLALLASLPKLGLGEEGLGWGGQFGSTGFNVTVASVVFAMALSLLGVWEIPIPGFFGSGSIHEAATKEGPFGAFLKGIVTTVLATPCTAPFMAAAVAWAVRQPVATTLAVFATLGLGMGSPYLLIGVYPELLRFVPKPGAWMETFKQISGFVLLGTVVFILSFIQPAAVVPTVALLLGIGVACWVVSRTPLTAEFGDRLKSYGVAGVVVLVFAGVSFGMMYRLALAPANAAWQPFSLERLKQVAVDEGRTVLVDFSAEWCLNCKFLEKTVLHTKPVEQAISRSGAVTMYADYTDYPDEIGRTIKALGANGVPVIAVFPGDTPYEPIVFPGGYTAGGLITALEKASGRRLKSGGQSIAEASAPSAPRN